MKVPAYPWSDKIQDEIEKHKGKRVAVHIEDGVVGVGNDMAEAVNDALNKGYIKEELYVDGPSVPSITSMFPADEGDEVELRSGFVDEATLKFLLEH